MKHRPCREGAKNRGVVLIDDTAAAQ